MADDNSIPLSWILIFLLLVLGIGVGAVFYVGGDVMSTQGALVDPLGTSLA